MTQRWWAPQRATTEPDAVVLAMLEPGDFGSAILATHRAGAAAIETVSKGALPSEQGLTTAMAAARANVADGVIDAVAKSVQTPTYAALLMRDVFDDAETAAVNLYRSAVAKGVTPSVAAQRAGLVYGVPANELGKYHTIATDPKASPAAVTDAADRVLMTYVSKLAAQEVTDGEWVEVSKAPVEHHHIEPTVSAGWKEQLHPRDAEGQFVRKPRPGIPPVMEPPSEPSRTAPPRAGTLEWLRQQLGMSPTPGAPARVADVETPPAPPRARPKARQRTARTARTGRQVARAPQQVQRQVARPQVQRQVSRVQVERQAKRVAELQRMAERVNPTMPAPAPRKDIVPVAAALPDLLQKHTPGEMHAYELDKSFAVTLSQAESIAFRNKLADQSGQLRDPSMRIFRLGHLADLAGSPDPTLSPDAAAYRRHIAEEQQADLPNYVAPLVDIIHPADMRRNEEHAMLYINQRRAEKAQRTVIDKDGFPRVITDQNELNWVHALPTYQPFGTVTLDQENRPIQRPEWAIVHFQVTDEQNPNARDIVTVDEFVIDYGARGTEEGVGDHIEYELDPNQAYEIIAPPGSRPGTRIGAQQFWDERNEVVVNRWYIRPVSEVEVEYQLGDHDDIGKAESQAYRPWREAEVVRDQLGRFAEEQETETETETAVPAPPTRATGHLPSRRSQRRVARTARAGRQVSRPQRPVQRPEGQVGRIAIERQVERPQASQLTPRQVSIQNAVQRAVVERIEETREVKQIREMPVLDDRKRYRVLTNEQWDHIMGLMPAAFDDGTIPVGGRGWADLSHVPVIGGFEVVGALNLNVEEAINAEEGPAQTDYEWQRRPAARGPMRSADDEFRMGLRIHEIFERFPDVAQLHIDYVTHPGEYVLYANRKPVSPQIIVEIDDDLDTNQPMVLIPLGTFRSTEMLHRRSDIEGNPLMPVVGEDPNPVNATMEQFRLQNAKVRRFRLGNE